MLGKEKRNREVQQDVAGKMNLSRMIFLKI